MKIFNLTVSAMCLALCILLPFLTGNNQALGNMLSLMHIPVLLCGFLAGPFHGLVVGAIAPFLRFWIIGAPPLFIAAPMSVELAVYGLAAGILYKILKKKNDNIYISLIGAMVLGRAAYGIACWVMYNLLGLFEPPFGLFTWELFVSTAIITSAPGIALHIVVIPLIVMALKQVRVKA